MLLRSRRDKIQFSALTKPENTLAAQRCHLIMLSSTVGRSGGAILCSFESGDHLLSYQIHQLFLLLCKALRIEIHFFIGNGPQEWRKNEEK